MQYRFLGRTGLRVSRLSFGSWVTFANQVDVEKAYEIMKVAYGRGVNFFDNAETYAKGKSEEVMGTVFQIGFKEGLWERDDLVVTTKIFFGTKDGVNAKGLSRKHVVEGTMASLKRLQLDYVDVIFCHRPDPFTPMEEIVRGFNHIIDKGQAFYWATSEWESNQIIEACQVADRLGLIKPVADQCEYNLCARDKVEMDYKPVFERYGYGTTIWSPLASGVLTGKYSNGVPDGSRFSLENYKGLMNEFLEGGEKAWVLDAVRSLQPIADEIGCTCAQLSIAWTLCNPNVTTCILGATSVQQLEENLVAMEVLEKITPEIKAKIDTLFDKSKPAPSTFIQRVAAMRSIEL